jgi:hypothetical protein
MRNWEVRIAFFATVAAVAILFSERVLSAAATDPVPCQMDADGDVDLDDLRLASACLPENPNDPDSPCRPADANQDGRVDGADLSICAHTFLESLP